MKVITRRLNSLVRRVEEQVREARQAGRAQRLRLAWQAYEASGRLPDDEEARKWCLLLDKAKEEFEALHSVIDDPAGYVNPGFAGGHNEQ